MTTVTWLLEEALGGTRLTLHHEGIGAAAGDAAHSLLMALDAGWDAHLVALETLPVERHFFVLIAAAGSNRPLWTKANGC